jgi:RHS repeat-associated protein
MGARFYAPELGIWTSPDPLAITDPTRLVTADFAAANPYAYANQTPLMAADRDGHFPQILAGAFAGALIGGGAELVHQLLEHGRIESYGRIGCAAAGGAVSGAIFAAAPSVAMSGVASTAGGITRRLLESGGKSAGTLREAAIDGTVGIVTAGATKGAGALLKAAAPKIASGVNALGRVVKGGGSGPAGTLKFSQTTASPSFSSEGTFTGKTIGGLSSELRAGTVAAKDVPVGYVTIGENNLIVNTRSALSLTRAGIPQESWTLNNVTSTQTTAIEDRLLRNGLTSEGTPTLRITGLGTGASNLE